MGHDGALALQMKPLCVGQKMRWSGFWGGYSKIISAVCAVVLVMLAMQGGLSIVKFKSTAAQAVASQMQVVGSTIEASVLRWEQLGVGMSEMDRLPALIATAADRSPVIDRIVILNPVGLVVQSTSDNAIPDADRDAILRRVLSAAEAESVIERGDWIYSGRLLTGSTGTAIGAVVMAAPKALYMPALLSLGQNIGWAYVVITLLASGLVLPVLIYHFRDFAALDLLLRNIRSGEAPTTTALHPDIAAVATKIRTGQEVAQDLRARIDACDRDTSAGGTA
jgi:hypothetical protein